MLRVVIGFGAALFVRLAVEWVSVRVHHVSESVHLRLGHGSWHACAVIRADILASLLECGFPISLEPASVSEFACTVWHLHTTVLLQRQCSHRRRLHLNWSSMWHCLEKWIRLCCCLNWCRPAYYLPYLLAKWSQCYRPYLVLNL